MKIAVSAASSQLGHAVLHELLSLADAGNIVAIARTPAKVDMPGIEKRAGDYTSLESMAEALSGIDTLVIISAPVGDWDRVLLHRNVINAARQAGVRKILFTSVIGGDTKDLPPEVPAVAKRLWPALERIEAVFAWPGIGRLLFESISKRDYPVMLAILLMVSATVVVANLATDIGADWDVLQVWVTAAEPAGDGAGLAEARMNPARRRVDQLRQRIDVGAAQLFELALHQDYLQEALLVGRQLFAVSGQGF